MKENDALYRMLSESNKELLQEGHLDKYADNLVAMAKIHREEGNFKDELKHLMIAFYIHLSGWNARTYIDWQIVHDICFVTVKLFKTKSEIREFYESVVSEDIVGDCIFLPSEAFEIFLNCADHIPVLVKRFEDKGIIPKN